jgi:hypothetical protein
MDGATGNWPSGNNAYQAPGGYLDKRAAHAPYDGTDGLDIKSKYQCILDSGQLATKGQDRRLVNIPIIDCPWDGKTTNVRGTACVLLLTPMSGDPKDKFVVEYLGGAESNACGSFGPPGGTGGTGPRVPTLVQ